NEEQWRRTESLIQAARKDQPESPLFALALGIVRDLQGRAEEAETVYREALQRESKNLLAYNNLAVLLAVQGKNGAEALTFIERPMDIAGPLRDFLDTRAIAYMALGKWEQAAKNLEEAVIQLEPRPTSNLRMARAYWMAGDKRAARKALEKAKAP